MLSDPGLPLTRAVEVADPIAALRALSALPHPFLLHSGLLDERARWSFFGADPFALDRGRDYESALWRWRAIAGRSRSGDDAAEAPFTGGAVGYWSYDFGRRLERLPARAADDLGLPDFLLAFYDVVGAFDHRSGRAWLHSSGLPAESDRGRARRRLDQFARLLDLGPRATAPAAARPV